RIGSHRPSSQEQPYLSSRHLISRLIDDSQQSFARTLASAASSLPDAAAKYRVRRGRHPPPGFETWYSLAQSYNAVIVEQFWDQICEDLEPLRGLTPPELRRRAQAAELVPRIRLQDGHVDVDDEEMGPHSKLDAWKAMLEELIRDGARFPNIRIDMAINTNNEPAVLVPWEEIQMLLLETRRVLPPAEDLTLNFSVPIGNNTSNSTTTTSSFDPEFLGPHLPPPSDGYLGPRPYRPYWSLVQPACPPSSAARKPPFNPILADIWQPQGHTDAAHSAPNLLLNRTRDHSGGYVGNWTKPTDICNMPWLQGLHGAFVAPDDIRTTQHMVPMFSGGGKLGVNNDILIPGLGDWNVSALVFDPTTSPVTTAWEKRNSKLYWRGPATGGKITRRNWCRLQRHRFVSMLNASHIHVADLNSGSANSSVRGVGPAGNFILPGEGVYEVEAQRNKRLSDWVRSWADVRFTEMECEDSSASPCAYFAEYFDLDENKAGDQAQQSYKYVAVLDGSGADDGGEFLRGLASGSVVLRASVYKDWKDARVWPWVHYVPLDNTFVDLYSVMAFFLGSSGGGSREGDGHDDMARRIAQEAGQWASKVLRREDMLLYLYRLVLEYARILDDSRERLGWAGDLV
ncbi:uncharacterized protein EI97DRAFT_363582, partial [Westerdykella ornata]